MEKQLQHEELQHRAGVALALWVRACQKPLHRCIHVPKGGNEGCGGQRGPGQASSVTHLKHLNYLSVTITTIHATILAVVSREILFCPLFLRSCSFTSCSSACSLLTVVCSTADNLAGVSVPQNQSEQFSHRLLLHTITTSCSCRCTLRLVVRISPQSIVGLRGAHKTACA